MRCFLYYNNAQDSEEVSKKLLSRKTVPGTHWLYGISCFSVEKIAFKTVLGKDGRLDLLGQNRT